MNKPINLPDSNYTPPWMLTSKKAKKKVKTQLALLKQFSKKPII